MYKPFSHRFHQRTSTGAHHTNYGLLFLCPRVQVVYTRTLAGKKDKIFYRKCLSFRDGDSVFGAQKRKNLKPSSRVENLNTLRQDAKLCSDLLTSRTPLRHIQHQYREINKHVGPSSCSGSSNKLTGYVQIVLLNREGSVIMFWFSRLR